MLHEVLESIAEAIVRAGGERSVWRDGRQFTPPSSCRSSSLGVLVKTSPESPPNRSANCDAGGRKRALERACKGRRKEMECGWDCARHGQACVGSWLRREKVCTECAPALGFLYMRLLLTSPMLLGAPCWTPERICAGDRGRSSDGHRLKESRRAAAAENSGAESPGTSASRT